jgi:hypothetical protein
LFVYVSIILTKKKKKKIYKQGRSSSIGAKMGRGGQGRDGEGRGWEG